MLRTMRANINHAVGMGDQLIGLSRCPHCSIANPTLSRMWAHGGPTPRRDGGQGKLWGSFLCTSCGSVVTATGADGGNVIVVERTFPEQRTAHSDIPEPARTFLQQAYDTLHAPDAAAVMAGSAVDGMLKAIGLSEGSLYKRIDEALARNLLTQGMAEWAHAVRLGSNRPRHADEEKPHVSPDEAKQSVEFAESLGNFLFVLTSKIETGIKAAKEAK